MPVGGDVTQFFLGLMAVLSRSLAQGTIPSWNGLWGYGFPGVGESQMGAFYPPHLILYGIFSLERAYVLSLVLHTLWGGLGGYWAARRFGAARLGAGLAGFVFAASGFFVIHLPHPWGYTTGAWMPWAWGLAWSLLDQSGRGTARRLFLLSVALTMQVLPGHFQIAFMTQATVGLMAAWSIIERRPMARVGLTLLGAAVVLPLAAAQVWPTARMAAMAEGHRDYEYLSGFAATPFHLVGLVAPRLFHDSPLWRPLIWDPFHTSPEELLAYVGIVPLILALMTLAREARRDAAARALGVLAIACLLLSLGPYLPGFRWLIQLPGFSFFRAPARWTLPMSLALAMLAGLGLDRWRSWERPGRGAVRLGLAAVAWVAVVLGLIELAVWSSSPSGSRAVEAMYTKAFAALPWEGDPDFRAVASLARRPSVDPAIPPTLERAGVRRSTQPRDPRSFEQRRWTIYREELTGTLAVLAAVIAIATVPRLRQRVPVLLVGLTFLDLTLLAGHRYVQVGRLQPLTEQSPVLAALAREPAGTRTIDPTRNLAMAAGLAPVRAYRTLDLPAMVGLSALAAGPIDGDLAPRAMRAVGAGLRVLDPIEVAAMKLRGVSPPGPVETIRDPELARWLFGPDWNAGEFYPALGIADGRKDVAPVDFQIVRAADAPIAWLVREPIPEASDGDPRRVLATVEAATPLPAASTPDAGWVVPLDGPGGTVLMSVLHDPQWRATVVGPDGREAAANVRPAFRVGEGGGAWMAIDVPPTREAGAKLVLAYDAADIRRGLWASAACWGAWIAAIIVMRRRERKAA
ncbi:hypothetical protein [Paludisphaera sp.]|uniref:hypothetical protein n=1 Tax=Paludisphaera sp. TaxID=2017432 RepID=UPI00301B9513